MDEQNGHKKYSLSYTGIPVCRSCQNDLDIISRYGVSKEELYTNESLKDVIWQVINYFLNLSIFMMGTI